MNRAEFMAALEAQLRDITTEERDEALKFYNEYLDEAGPENEAAVLAELGSPQKVACIIRANCGFGVPAVRDAAEKSTAPDKPEQAPLPELTLDGPDWRPRSRRRKQNALGPKASARTRKLRTVSRMRRRRTARSTALPMHTAIPKTARTAKTADAPPPTARSGSSCSFSPVPSGSASSAACSAA